jgi:predicted nuclease with TOPRIM domain
MALTIQGYKFEVPEGVLAKFQPGYTLASEGEAHALKQTLAENLRNNFAAAVKKELNGAESLSEEQVAKLQSEFADYATKYEFGIRQAGEARQRLDPLTREMLRLAKDDFSKAYFTKFGEKADKEMVAERGEELMDKRRDDYMKRAKAILRQREQTSTDTLEALGL